MFNFNELIPKDVDNEKTLDPESIFRMLSSKSEKYGEYLRNVQSEVLEKWFVNRDNKDNIIRMNTGSGKTVVGLLILQSCLNEKKGPAVYIVPDNYLINQVVKEAEELGISITTNRADLNFRTSKAILVINIQTLVNGKTYFGMRAEYSENLKIGSIIIDDVHACLNYTESQFKLEFNNSSAEYKKILEIFKDDIKAISEYKYDLIKSGEKNSRVIIPFYKYRNKLDSVRKVIHDNESNSDNIKFVYPLLADVLKLTDCVISGNKIEISTKILPINKISSFVDAQRRIFMSATLSDDSSFISHFDIEEKSFKSIITPNKMNDMGERLILVPETLDNDITSETVREMVGAISKKINTTVIVPSGHKASLWNDLADRILYSDSINKGIGDLKESDKTGLTVLVNRYDGIDLPDNLCRLLVIDDLPKARTEYDYIEEGVLRGSERLNNISINRIEQGMGRGVRSASDYCVVFLMGEKLINTLYVDGGIDKFSAGLKRQMEFSKNISNKIKEVEDKKEKISGIFDLMKIVYDRDKNWVESSRRNVINTNYDDNINIDELVLAERKAFNLAELSRYKDAKKELDSISNNIMNDYLKGYFLEKIAKYTDLFDQQKSQEILMGALEYNRLVTNPINGIQKEKIMKKYSMQARKIREVFDSFDKSKNSYVYRINSILADLEFRENSYVDFEIAFKSLGEMLGFESSRHDLGGEGGPDVVWRLNEKNFLNIECKNECIDTNEISKRYINQVNGHTNWFKDKYSEGYNQFPVIIHPSNKANADSYPDRNMKVINGDKLDLLKTRVKEFSVNLVQDEYLYDFEKITELLKRYKLFELNIHEYYTENIIKSK